MAERLRAAVARQPASVRRAGAFVAVFTLAYVLFLMVRPLDQRLMVRIADPLMVLGLAIGAALCFIGPDSPVERVRLGRHPFVLGCASQRYVPCLLGLGVVIGVFTGLIFAYYDIVRGYPSPPASLADLLFIVAHPFALLAILLLPATGLQLASRTRVAVDGLLVLAASITFAWYFILGPVMVHGDLTTLGALSQAAYPVSDLFVVVCLLMLSSYFDNASMRLPAGILSLGLGTLVATDMIFDYQRMHQEYVAGRLLDAGWTFAGLMVGFAALAIRYSVTAQRQAAGEREGVRERQAESPALHLMRSLVPYALVVGVGLLTLYTWRRGTDTALKPGIYIGAALIVCLVLVRQLLTIVENVRLFGHLNEAYGETVRQSERLQSLVKELYQAQETVEARNRALALANARLEVMATHDGLTGLPNRTLFDDSLAREIREARLRGGAVGVLLIDLDRFKEVNDAFGPRYGDELLIQVGHRLGSAIGEGALLARLGDDEYAVVLPATTEDGAIRLGLAILAALRAPIMVETKLFETFASIGIALYPQHGDDSQSLLQRADVAMYVAKRSHAGYAVYAADHDRHLQGRMTRTSELRLAIESGQLVLYLQPKVNLTTQRIDSVEGLVRWRHPTHGLIPPADFIPLAEQTGLIVPLTEWLLREVRRQWERWSADGWNLPIAVNLPPSSLHDHRLLDAIKEVSAADPSGQRWLEVEIVESSLMTDPERSMEVLSELRGMGVRSAIDDFGAGYSSLGHLKKLPVDSIKIDRSFVTDMATDEDDALIVRSVVGLGHSLGMQVVGEGVEDRTTADLLRTLGCDAAQGYYFGRPSPADGLSWRLPERRVAEAG